MRQEKAFLVDLQRRALELKGKGVHAEEAGQRLTAEFKTQYADWPIHDLTNLVKRIYAE